MHVVQVRGSDPGFIPAGGGSVEFWSLNQTPRGEGG